MNNRNRVLTVFLAALILGMTGGFVIGLNPSFQTVIQPGSLTLPCSYLVFKDGTNTFSRDCQTGAIITSSSSSTVVIQSVLNSTAATGGKSILFAPGTYNVHGLSLSNGLTRVNGISMRGLTGSYSGTVFSYDGAAGGTILNWTGVAYSTFDSIQLACNSVAGIGMTIQAAPGNNPGSTTNTISNSFFYQCNQFGLQLGDNRSFQTSEIKLISNEFRGNNIGLGMIGYNTLNIEGFGLGASANRIGLYVRFAGFTAFTTVFSQNTIEDIYLQNPGAPFSLHGGYSENSAALLLLPSQAGVNELYKITDFRFTPSVSNATIVTDNSRLQGIFINVDFFGWGQLVFNGPGGTYATSPSVKSFINCRFDAIDGTEYTPVAWIQHISGKSVVIEVDSSPIGKRVNTFNGAGFLQPWTQGSPTTAPSASGTYTVDGQNILITSTGGTGVSWTIADQYGNVVQSGLATLTSVFVPVGYTVNPGAFSVAPTVTVFFVGV